MKSYFMHARHIVFVASFIILSACSSSFDDDYKLHVKGMHTTLLDAAKEAAKIQKKRSKEYEREISSLLVGDDLNKVSPTKKIQNTYSVTVNKAPADIFFATLADMYDESIVLSPDIVGELTINMKDVTIGEILKAVRRIYGFEFEKTAYGYNIFMPRLETKVFILNRLDVERSGSSGMSVSGNKGSGGGGSSSVSTSVSTDFWANLKETLDALISKDPENIQATRRGRGGSKSDTKVVINKDTGLIVIRAYPAQLRQIEAYLKKTQETLQRQVIIEAKILDVELNDQHASGINWSALGHTLVDGKHYSLNFDNGSAKPSSASDVPGQALTLGMARTNEAKFGAFLNIIGGQGKISVLSSPRISTLNNQKAVIKVGKDSFYSTGVNGTSTLGAGGTTSNSQNVTIQSFFNGVALDVTPQISDDDQITLHIHPVITHVTNSNQSVEVDGKKTTVNAPTTRTRETDTIVRAKDGQIIIIGGLMENQVTLNDSKPSISDNFGVVKDLLSKKDHVKRNKELIILLKPIIVKEDTWERELRSTAAKAFNKTDL